MNGLDYGTNEVVKNLFNLVFQNGFLPLIQRPTRVTRTSTTAIDHILKAQRQMLDNLQGASFWGVKFRRKILA